MSGNNPVAELWNKARELDECYSIEDIKRINKAQELELGYMKQNRAYIVNNDLEFILESCQKDGKFDNVVE